MSIDSQQAQWRQGNVDKHSTASTSDVSSHRQGEPSLASNPQSLLIERCCCPIIANKLVTKTAFHVPTCSSAFRARHLLSSGLTQLASAYLVNRNRGKLVQSATGNCAICVLKPRAALGFYAMPRACISCRSRLPSLCLLGLPLTKLSH